MGLAGVELAQHTDLMSWNRGVGMVLTSVRPV